MKPLVLAIALLLAFPTLAHERIDLTTPEEATVGASSYTIQELNLHWGETSVIVVLVADNGKTLRITYDVNTGAANMLNELATADFTVKSLTRRVMERLIADKHLVGHVSETPDE